MRFTLRQKQHINLFLPVLVDQQIKHYRTKKAFTLLISEVKTIREAHNKLRNEEGRGIRLADRTSNRQLLNQLQRLKAYRDAVAQEINDLKDNIEKVRLAQKDNSQIEVVVESPTLKFATDSH